ncbi:MAG TPA: hypothetical protein PK819_07350 [Thermomicrobiales bacterium]|nr:hypothetical protein [Thermomicrobiales bacterium]
MVDERGAVPQIKREQEAHPPAIPHDPEALEEEKRSVIKANLGFTVALAVIFIIVVVVLIF